MTNPTTLTDAIRNAVLYQIANIHTVFPGRIISYEYKTKKAVIQPSINKAYVDGMQPMPVLNNVPVIFPYSGGASLTFPVRADDYCLVLCCERSIDQWLQNGGQVTPNDPRKYDLTDAVAIMGLLPFTETSPASNNDELLLQYAGSKIRIKEDGAIVIETASTVAIGTQTTELLDVLSQLMGYLIGGTVMGAAFGGPLSPGFVAAVTALQAQLDAIKGTIP
jgi:hypothetical protein